MECMKTLVYADNHALNRMSLGSTQVRLLE